MIERIEIQNEKTSATAWFSLAMDKMRRNYS